MGSAMGTVTGRAGWWRPPAELVLFAVVATVCAGLTIGAGLALAGLAGVPATADGLGDPLWETALGFATVAALLPAVAITVRWAGGRSLGTVASVAGRLRRRWLAACLTPALALLAAQVALTVAAERSWDPDLWPGWRTYAAMAVVSLTLVPLQAAAEEYVTRGWLVQTLSAWTGSRLIAAALSSALFVALHGTANPWAVADLAVFALALCWLTFRTGGLEAALVLHVAVNVAYTLAGTTQGIPDLDAEVAYRAQDGLAGIAVTLLYTGWITLRARRQLDRGATPSG